MEKGGTYRFVLHFYDDYADSYKNHQVKAALEVNAQRIESPIAYINGNYGGNWYGAWCRMPKAVHKRTHRFNPPQSRGAVVFVDNNTLPGEVRAAVNGGFFTSQDGQVRMLGEVGTGTAGNWEEDAPYPSRRWCFGMHETGMNFGVAQMEPRPDGVHYRVATSIENAYPFGLRGIGNLSVNDPTWPSYNTPTQRAALAWGGRHFFLIVAERWTWEQTRNFLFNELPRHIQKTYGERIRITNAIMLDGGGSTQFNYCKVRRDGSYEVQTHDLSDGRRITTMVHVWAIWDR